MARRMEKSHPVGLPAQCALALCLIASGAELVLGLTSTATPVPGDALLMLYVAGPYVLLGALAWAYRTQRGASWGLLVVALGVAALGLYLFGIDSYRYHTDPEYRQVQRMTAFVVPILQGAVVLTTGLGLWIRRRLLLRSARM